MMMKSSVEASRALAIYAALQFDRARAHTDEQQRAAAQLRGELLIPIVKGWCTEQVNEVTSLGVQVHGGMGFIEETGAAQTMRDARITAIYEGTTAIQANDLIGRKLVRDNGAALNSLLDDLTAMLQQAASDTDATQDISAAAVQAMTQLRHVSARLAQRAGSAPAEAFAVSVPYLMCCGFVLGGALLAQAARIATRDLDQPGADGDFLRAKIQTARFYMNHWLPQAGALARVVDSGGDSVIAVDVALI
jgi:acyl-CoA dehydrogenase